MSDTQRAADQIEASLDRGDLTAAHQTARDLLRDPEVKDGFNDFLKGQNR